MAHSGEVVLLKGLGPRRRKAIELDESETVVIAIGYAGHQGQHLQGSFAFDLRYPNVHMHI